MKVAEADSMAGAINTEHKNFILGIVCTHASNGHAILLHARGLTAYVYIFSSHFSSQSSVWLLVPFTLGFYDSRTNWATAVIQASVMMACLVSTAMWRGYTPGSCLHTSDFIFAG